MSDFRTKLRDQILKAREERRIGPFRARLMLRFIDDNDDCEMVEHQVRTKLFGGLDINWDEVDWDKWLEIFKIIMALIGLLS